MGYDSGFISGVNDPDTHYSCRIREEAEQERAEAAERKLARVRAVVPVLQEGARYCNENDRHPERAGGIEWALGKLEAALAESGEGK